MYVRSLKPRSIGIPKKVVVLVDDREKKEWKLAYTTKKVRLETGDYSFAGHQNRIAIEKKNGWCEFLANLSGQDRERFKAALMRLAAMPVKYIVIEDSFDMLPRALRELPKKARITEDSVYHWFNWIVVTLGIPVLLIGRSPRIKQRNIDKFFEMVIKTHL